MKVWIEKVTEADFYKMDIPVLFNDKMTSRCFGVITNGNQSFGLSWQSDLILPELVGVDSDIYTVGIDQDFCIVNLVTQVS